MAHTAEIIKLYHKVRPNLESAVVRETRQNKRQITSGIRIGQKWTIYCTEWKDEAWK